MTADPSQGVAGQAVVLPPRLLVQTVISGLGYTSGQVAVDGEAGLIATGKVGADVDVETAARCARQCALNVLAQLQEAFGDRRRRAAPRQPGRGRGRARALSRWSP